MRKKWLWSISTIVIIFSFCLAILSISIVFPWGLIGKFLDDYQSLDLVGYIQLLSGSGAVIWALISFSFLDFRKRRKSERILQNSDPLFLENYPNLKLCMQRLSEFGGHEEIEYRLVKSASDAPEALRTIKKNNRTRNVIIVPTRFWNKFTDHPEALSAVLVHETAHFNNGDIALLFSTRRFILVAFWICFFCSSISLVSSIYADSPSFELIAIWASIIGKSYLWNVIFLLLLLYLLQKKIEGWREALADQEAIKICGEEALRDAEKLLEGKHSSGFNFQRSDRRQVERALVLTPYWIIFLGFTISEIQSRFIAPFAYLREFWGIESIALNILFEVSFTFLLYLGYFYVLAVVCRHAIQNGKNFVDTFIRNATFLVVGSSLAWLVIEVIPLSLASTLMPEGYDNISRVDNLSSFITFSLLSSAISSSGYLILAGFGAWISASRHRLFIGILPGLAWALLSKIEMYFIPSLFEGWLAIIVTALTVIALVFYNRNHMSLCVASLKSYLSFFPILLLVFAGYMGYGDTGHLAVCASYSGVSKIESGNVNEAIPYYEDATRYAPRHPKVWMELSRALARSNRLREAVQASDKAVNAPFNFHWSEKFQTLALAGALRLKLREPGDLEIAAKYFLEAEQMWRDNSRLSHDEVSIVLYNIACIYALKDKDAIESVIYLLEASKLQPSIAKQSFTDPDLSILKLAEQEAPSNQDVQLFKYLDNVSAEHLRTLVQRKELSANTLLSFMAFRAHEF